MFEHEAESDEDCEVYFLKPVNEYNIVDKIKEANKELFAYDDEDGEQESSLVDSDVAAVNRKVTFALNLEDYEPTNDACKSLEAKDQIEDGDENEGVDVVVNELEVQMQSTVLKCATIVEEPLLEVETVAAEDEIDSSLKNHTTLVEDSQNNIEEVETKMEEVCVAEDEDDICEEIIVTDMDCEKAEEEIVPGRRIVKQNTFDYDEQDNKSMTNLLPSSDCEYEADDTLNDDNDDDDALDETFPNTFDDDDDDDDDDINDYDDDANENDDVSIIVASYLTDDMFMENVKTKHDKSSPNNYSTMKKLPSSPTSCAGGGGGGGQESKQNRFFSTKSFSLRRKSAKLSVNNKSHDEEQMQVRELKLSYKTCCEYRNAKQEKLPKYTGYLSEYGLSHDQLMRREDQYRRKQRYVLEQTLKSNEDDMKKMQDNERAFTRWLKNKMRYPINKTRNMFDAKLRIRNRMVDTCSGTGSGHECLDSTRFK